MLKPVTGLHLKDLILQKTMFMVMNGPFLALKFVTLSGDKQREGSAAQNSMSFALTIVTKQQKNVIKLIMSMQKSVLMQLESALMLAVNVKRIANKVKKIRKLAAKKTFQSHSVNLNSNFEFTEYFKYLTSRFKFLLKAARSESQTRCYLGVVLSLELKGGL